MKKSAPQKNARTHLVGTGLFVSVPDAFSGAENPLRHFAKVNLALQSPQANPTKTDAVVLSDRILFDIGVLRGLSINIDKLIADCDLVRKVAVQHPKQLQSLLDLASKNDFVRAEKIAKQLGLTEKASLSKGGGLLWLVALVVVAVAASGCRGCAHNPKSGGKLPDYNGKDGGK